MTDLEKLLIHTHEQTVALIKASAMLSETARQLIAAQDTIIRLQSENELLRLDLAEARAA